MYQLVTVHILYCMSAPCPQNIKLLALLSATLMEWLIRDPAITFITRLHHPTLAWYGPSTWCCATEHQICPSIATQMPHEPDSDDSASEPNERPANPDSESVSMHHKSASSLQHVAVNPHCFMCRCLDFQMLTFAVKEKLLKHAAKITCYAQHDA